MIRVLQMTGVLNMGGVETMIMRLYRCIDKSSFYYDFLTYGGSDAYYYEDEIHKIGGGTFRMPKRSENFIRHHTELYKRIKSGNYDAVHIHGTNPYFIASHVFVIRLAGQKNVIVHSHSTNDWRNAREKHKLLKAIAYRYMRHAVKLRLACSGPAAEWLFGERKGVRIFPLPVDCSRFSFDADRRAAFRSEHGLEGKKIYAHVGRFGEEKNHSFMIKCFSHLAKLDDNAVLFLIGDGPLRKDIEAKVRELKLEDKVIFWGNINDVDEKLNAADVFLLPSIYEGMPTVAIEAQAVGLPCLISDQVTEEIKITPLAELMPLEQGAIAWAEKLSSMPVLSAEERLNVHDIVADKYDIKRVTRELEDIYRDISGT